ncbi:SAM-dependent methyltransferase [Actinoalloteichus hymeniacidonis]|uniref:S-adenosyl methyltransferase n=1 Tax=Actinoalloteichus hymeniacidonis TaxID=340345 RepID=A0AAC9HMR1_9PSEU|nr:SAM-dependent methyltransferase [Actinoalloteichus hymeniacidonis]AOS62108.1 S-adenosyl methyltransferase [Actinoalloteichus hymeniacidonis]MBB5909870.1 hypothetical protein [Actinoalloteichus hymeniacidonis]
MASLPGDPPGTLPKDVDGDKPAAARVYDYLLGGDCNFAADRELARKTLSVLPEAAAMARINRAFLGRAVRFCAKNGITQFLDLGSGVPTVGNVHEVAQQVAPDCRVVYVDNDPVAVAHSEMILEDNDLAGVVHADVRTPQAVLRSPVTTALIDFDRPVAVLMVALLHFVPDSARPKDIVASFRERMAPGSMVVISHGTDDAQTDEMRRVADFYASSTNPLTVRKYDEVKELFAGFELAEPGLVWAPEWRPQDCDPGTGAPSISGVHVGVGLKP